MRLSGRWSLSFRAWLILLVLAATMPLASYALFHVTRGYLAERSALIDRTASVARMVARQTDQELGQEVLALQTLAAAPAVQAGDFAEFATLARMFLAEVAPGGTLFVFDADGRTLFTNAGALGPSMSRRNRPEISALVFRTHAPSVSVSITPAGAPVLVGSIDVPVARGRDVAYDLSLRLPLRRLQEIVEDQSLPAGQMVAIMDTAGTLVARAPNPRAAVGLPASREARMFLASGISEGSADLRLLNGTEALAVFARTPRFGWAAGIAIPRSQLFAPLRASVREMLVAGAAALALSLGLALLVARRLAAPVSTLARLAAALDGSDVLLAHEPGLREADGVARVLCEMVRRRRAAEDSAGEAELRAARLIEAVPCGVIVFGPSGRWEFVNREVCAMLARSAEELRRLTVESPDLDVRGVDGLPIPPAERASARALRGEAVREMEVSMVRGTGDRIALLLSAVPLRGRDGQVVGALTAMLDVSERRAAQDRLDALRQTLEQRVQDEVAAREAAQEEAAQAQKMRALGQLAGGVAHDFNNVLQAISGAIALIERRAGNPEDVRRFARTAAASAERGAAVAGRLLTFARRGDLRAAPVDAGELLCDTAVILLHTLSAQIIVRSETAPDAGWLIADGPQLQTVLVNLAANARDAMPEGGTLTLRASAESVAPGAAHPAGLRPGRYVRLDAVDTGAGMDADTLARATEPFFTTKPVSKGTGLGLAMARGFVEQLGGGIGIESAPGRGTTVHLWLPAADPPTAEANRASTARALPGTRVLLVDDEDIVRATLAEELVERGYEVHEAADAAEACGLLRARRFDVLVTDFSMPGETGTALIAAARRIRPGMPALLLTGMVADVALDRDLTPTDAALTEILAKPARAADIAARIDHLTAGAASLREPLT